MLNKNQFESLILLVPLYTVFWTCNGKFQGHENAFMIVSKVA
jgi:hypothetical protein